ncbi:MAG: hypothetical protein GVY17_15075 [Cyanobacteria bacterium]|jgi:multidrug efflux pump subunit AcrA (membrane-fusion protein)|nr:hypothetical protein [Cyanobacteria bacterium GSL.Bin21]
MAEISKEEMRDRLGNLDQIRELLFGKQSREYEYRLDQIESELAQFQEATHHRLSELREELVNEIQSAINALEKQLKYVRLNSQEEVSHLRQSVEENRQRTQARINALSQTLNATSESLRSELGQTREQLQTDIQHLKQELDEEIESHFRDLGQTKISRDDFAEILFNLCLKIKGSDSDVLADSEATEKELDYLLPDRPNYSETASDAGEQ